VQVVGYDTGVDPAALLVAEGGDVDREPLTPGRELDYGLHERRCAGRVADGVHEPCEEAETPYCREHTSRWPCARCNGQCSRPVEACHEKHAVYLAAFAPDQFKVGVTRSWRLQRRLQEQGADRGAHVHTVSDGRIARRREAGIAASVGDRVRIESKVAGLHLSVEESAWERLLGDHEVLERFDFEDGLDLSSQPVPATALAGSVRGTKGRLLVLDRGATTYAVDLRDLVGHAIEPGARGDRQSSLAAFE
jgi:hypothetical protein